MVEGSWEETRWCSQVVGDHTEAETWGAECDSSAGVYCVAAGMDRMFDMGPSLGQVEPVVEKLVGVVAAIALVDPWILVVAVGLDQIRELGLKKRCFDYGLQLGHALRSSASDKNAGKMLRKRWSMNFGHYLLFIAQRTV